MENEFEFYNENDLELLNWKEPNQPSDHAHFTTASNVTAGAFAATAAAAKNSSKDKLGDSCLAILVEWNEKWWAKYHQIHRQHSTLDFPGSIFDTSSVWMNQHHQQERLRTDAGSSRAKQVVKEYEKIVKERLRYSLGRKGTVEEIHQKLHQAPFQTTRVDIMPLFLWILQENRCQEHHMKTVLSELGAYLKVDKIQFHPKKEELISVLIQQLFVISTNFPIKFILKTLNQFSESIPKRVCQAWCTEAKKHCRFPEEILTTLDRRYHKKDPDISKEAQFLLQLINIHSQDQMNRPTKSFSRDSGFAKYQIEDTNKRMYFDIFDKVQPKSISKSSTNIKRVTKSITKKRGSSIPSFHIVSNPYLPTILASTDGAAKEGEIIGSPNARASHADSNTARDVASPTIKMSQLSQPKQLQPLASPSPSPNSKPSPTSRAKKKVTQGSKYQWTREDIRTVAGFEWYWRSLPPTSTALRPNAKVRDVFQTAKKLHMEHHELDEAVQLYEFALRQITDATFVQHPEAKALVISIHQYLGGVYETMGMFASAVSRYYQVLEQQPDLCWTRFRLGLALYQLGDWNEAHEEMKCIYETLAASNYHSRAHSVMKAITQSQAGAGTVNAQELYEKWSPQPPSSNPDIAIRSSEQERRGEEGEEEEGQGYSSSQWETFTVIAVSGNRLKLNWYQMFDAVDLEGMNTVLLTTVLHIFECNQIHLTRTEKHVFSTSPSPLIITGTSSSSSRVQVSTLVHVFAQALARANQYSMPFSLSSSTLSTLPGLASQKTKKYRLMKHKMHFFAQAQAREYLLHISTWSQALRGLPNSWKTSGHLRNILTYPFETDISAMRQCAATQVQSWIKTSIELCIESYQRTCRLVSQDSVNQLLHLSMEKHMCRQAFIHAFKTRGDVLLLQQNQSRHALTDRAAHTREHLVTQASVYHELQEYVEKGHQVVQEHLRLDKYAQELYSQDMVNSMIDQVIETFATAQAEARAGAELRARAEPGAELKARIEAEERAKAKERAKAQAEAQERAMAQAEAQERAMAQAEAQGRAKAQVKESAQDNSDVELHESEQQNCAQVLEWIVDTLEKQEQEQYIDLESYDYNQEEEWDNYEEESEYDNTPDAEHSYAEYAQDQSYSVNEYDTYIDDDQGYSDEAYESDELYAPSLDYEDLRWETHDESSTATTTSAVQGETDDYAYSMNE